MKKLILTCLAAVALTVSNMLFAKTFTMGVVVKIGGIPWFNAMEKGIEKEARKLGVKAYQIGPTAADPALQVRAIEDLIAQRVDVIGIVPNDAKVLEPVLKKARDAGIKIISHESPGQKYVDWDFELVGAEQQGINHMKKLAKCMGEQGGYATYVGSLMVPLHNVWADAAIAYQQEHYPQMHPVADRFGVAESLHDTMRTTRELMSRYSDLKGIIAFGSQGPIGAGRAVMQRHKTDDICVIGPFSPGQGGRLVKTGAIDGGYIWNPMTAGEIFVRLASMLMNGELIKDNMTIEGMGQVAVDEKNRIILANVVESLDRENIDKLVIKMGLETVMSTIIHVSDVDFQSVVLASDKTVLVDFWATWCEYCRAIEPVLEELAEEYGERVQIAKINFDDNPKTRSSYGIRSLPTLIIFKNGEAVATQVGTVSKSQLANMLDDVLQKGLID